MKGTDRDFTRSPWRRHPPAPSQPKQLAMAPRAGSHEHKPLLVRPIDEQPVRLDVALAMAAIRPTYSSSSAAIASLTVR